MNRVELRSAIKGAIAPDYTKFSQAQADEATKKFNDVKEGDLVEAYIMVEVPR